MGQAKQYKVTTKMRIDYCFVSSSSNLYCFNGFKIIKFNINYCVSRANASYESVRKDLASKLAVERVTTKKLELQVVGLERELQQKVFLSQYHILQVDKSHMLQY